MGLWLINILFGGERAHQAIMPYCEKYHNMKGLDCQPIILLIFVIIIANTGFE